MLAELHGVEGAGVWGGACSLRVGPLQSVVVCVQYPELSISLVDFV
jgi:hypothetical protein